MNSSAPQPHTMYFCFRYGRFQTCLRLLDAPNGRSLINDSDGMGHTALHAAAEEGHAKVLTLLLERGATCSKYVYGILTDHLNMFKISTFSQICSDKNTS